MKCRDRFLVLRQILSRRTCVSVFESERAEQDSCVNFSDPSAAAQDYEVLLTCGFSFLFFFLCFSLWYAETRSDLSASHETSRRMTTVSPRLSVSAPPSHSHTRSPADNVQMQLQIFLDVIYSLYRQKMPFDNLCPK